MKIYIPAISTFLLAVLCNLVFYPSNFLGVFYLLGFFGGFLTVTTINRVHGDEK